MSYSGQNWLGIFGHMPHLLEAKHQFEINPSIGSQDNCNKIRIDKVISYTTHLLSGSII